MLSTDDEDQETTSLKPYTYEPPQVLQKPIKQHYTKGNGRPGSRWYRGWNGVKPLAIVVHYSASFGAQGCMNALVRRGLSAHCTIERDGVVWRHVSDQDRAIHAGYGRWYGLSNMNHHAFGVEIANLGWMEGINPDGVKGFIGVEANPMSDGNIYFRMEGPTRVLTRTGCTQVLDHRREWRTYYWSVYPEAQLDAVFWQIWEWVKRHDILLENVIGHEHVTPHRKQDPGPAFPWGSLAHFLWERCLDEKPELIDPQHRLAERVKAVQSHCERMGVDVGRIDGVWGERTQAAVEEIVEDFGEIYRFSDLTAEPLNCLEICNAFRLVPGFNPGTRV